MPKRKRWVAVLLTLCLPGLGHLYSGAPKRGVVVFLVLVLLSPVGLVLSAAAPPTLFIPLIAATALIAIAVVIAAIVDAMRTAERAADAFVPMWYNRWYIYAALAIVMNFGFRPIMTNATNKNIVETYRIPSVAMEPAVLAGDYIVTRPLKPPVSRGSIVVFMRDSSAIIQRVVGRPGDTLQMIDGALIVNGARTPEPYVNARTESLDAGDPDFEWQREYLTSAVSRSDYAPRRNNWGPLVLPAEKYFLLGDNREFSLDSRYVGFTNAAAILKRPTVVYFSRDRDTGEIRWQRMGVAVR